MSNVLFVKGHPGTAASSVSVKLAEAFLDAYKAANPNDTISTVDVYSDHIPQIDADVLSAYDKFQSGRAAEVTPEEGAKVGQIGALTDQFMAADKVIFAAPMWNFGYPSLVKAYIDTAVVSTGRTFKYTANGPVGLLTGKKAIILEASGGQYSGTPMAAYTHSHNHLKGVLGFVGISDVQVVTAEGMNANPDKRDEIIAAAVSNSKTVAATF